MAPYISLIQAQIGVLPEATDTLMELFRDNRRLLDSLTDDQIFFFILFLQEKGSVPSFIKFLSVLCSCQGVALPKNQNFILQKLVEDRSHLLVSLKLVDDKIKVLNDSREWINLEEYINVADDDKLQYFTLTIELFSNLCLGSNSRAIAVLSKLLSYNLVLTAIKCNPLPPHLRASFCYLMLNLYVRNKPQKPINFVNYTRLWIDLRAGASLSVGREGGEYDFGQLKQFIFAFLAENTVQIIAHWSANKLTLSVLVLCRYLMSLGFFGAEEVRPLIQPLISLLDGRTDVMNVVPTNRKRVSLTEDSAGRPWILDEKSLGIKSRYEKSDLSIVVMEVRVPCVSCSE